MVPSTLNPNLASLLSGLGAELSAISYFRNPVSVFTTGLVALSLLKLCARRVSSVQEMT